MQDEKKTILLLHLSQLLTYFTAIGGIVVPLVIWFLKKDTQPNIDIEGRKIINFQINIWVFGVIAALLMFVFIGFLILPIIGLVGFVFPIIAAMKWDKGEDFEYPVLFKIL